MSFTIKFSNQKEHDAYIRHQAKKLGLDLEEEKTINASEILGTVHKTYKKRHEMNHRPWNDADEKFLAEHWITTSTKKLSKMLQRNTGSLTSRIDILRHRGISIPSKKSNGHHRQGEIPVATAVIDDEL